MTVQTLAQYHDEGRTFVIAEIAQAHDGSVGILHSLLEGAAAAGVDAVKFQVHIADAESSSDEPFRIPFSYVDASRYAYWKRMELAEKEWSAIRDHCRRLGVEFLATPFSNSAVELLESLGVMRYKVGSGDIGNPLLLEKIARTGKETILSTGLGGEGEIDAAVALLRSHNVPVAIMQCTTKYPTVAEDVGLRNISWLAERYSCPSGLSDHSGTIYAGLAACALGATMIEVHTTFDRRMFGPDSMASLTLDELGKLVEGVRFINVAGLAPPGKAISDDMNELRRIFGKSLALNRDMNAGEEIRYLDLEGKKPADRGIPVGEMERVMGRRLCCDKKQWDFLRYEDLA